MILLLTHSGDFYTIDGVEAALQRLGARYARIDTDRFPMQYTLSVRPGVGAWLEAAGTTLNLGEVTSVWSRRLYPGHLPPEMPPEQARFCAETCRTAFYDALAGLEQAFWINAMAAAERAESKLRQLAEATQTGFRVPPTLVSNRPDSVREFMQEHGNLVTKLLVQPVQSMQPHPAFSYTTRVLPEHLGHLDQLRLMPQIFQPELKKRRELRVVVVGRQLFTGALEGGDPQMVDWRSATPESGLRWVAGNLSDILANRILVLMQRLGLVFGALDFIEDGSGEPWFLEVNQAGEWGWLQRDLGFPIAEAIAASLAQRR